MELHLVSTRSSWFLLIPNHNSFLIYAGAHLYTLKIVGMELTRTKHWERIWALLQGIMALPLLASTAIFMVLRKDSFFVAATALILSSGWTNGKNPTLQSTLMGSVDLKSVNCFLFNFSNPWNSDSQTKLFLSGRLLGRQWVADPTATTSSPFPAPTITASITEYNCEVPLTQPAPSHEPNVHPSLLHRLYGQSHHPPLTVTSPATNVQGSQRKWPVTSTTDGT